MESVDGFVRLKLFKEEIEDMFESEKLRLGNELGFMIVSKNI